MSFGPTTNIHTVKGDAFDAAVLRADGPVAVEFMSYSCGYCRALEPVLELVAEQLASREQVFRVNIASERGLSERYEIEGTPTLVMFLDGTEVGRVEGPHAAESSLMMELMQPFAMSS